MIKFVCGDCGKHLRARDEMAMKRVFCPKCNALVGVPSLQPALGSAGPMSPRERLQHARGRMSDPTDRAALAAEQLLAVEHPPRATRMVRLATGKPRRSSKNDAHLEKHWTECLVYPLRAYPICLGLAMMLTLLSAGLLIFLPRLLADAPEGMGQVAFHWTWIITVAFLVGFPCTFFDAVLTSACAGEVDSIRWSGNIVGTLFLGSLRWMACFLVGPVVFAAALFFYWLTCGDPAWVDWFILIQLGLVAIGSQLYVLLSMSDRGQMRDINPLAVTDLAHRLGIGGLATVLIAAAVFLLHGWSALKTVPQIHQGTLVGWLLLAAIWVSTVYFGTFFARLLGLACYRSRKRTPKPSQPEDAPSD